MESQYPRLDRIEKDLEAFFQGIAELRAAQLKTDEQLNKTDEQISELRATQLETAKMLKNTTKQLADIGLVQGEVAEDIFYRNTKTLFQSRGMRFPGEGGAALLNREDFEPKAFD